MECFNHKLPVVFYCVVINCENKNVCVDCIEAHLKLHKPEDYMNEVEKLRKRSIINDRRSIYEKQKINMDIKTNEKWESESIIKKTKHIVDHPPLGSNTKDYYIETIELSNGEKVKVGIYKISNSILWKAKNPLLYCFRLWRTKCYKFNVNEKVQAIEDLLKTNVQVEREFIQVGRRNTKFTQTSIKFGNIKTNQYEKLNNYWWKFSMPLRYYFIKFQQKTSRIQHHENLLNKKELILQKVKEVKEIEKEHEYSIKKVELLPNVTATIYIEKISNPKIWNLVQPLRYFFRKWRKIINSMEETEHINLLRKKTENFEEITEREIRFKIGKKKLAPKFKVTTKVNLTETEIIETKIQIKNKTYWKFTQPKRYYFNKWLKFKTKIQTDKTESVNIYNYETFEDVKLSQYKLISGQVVHFKEEKIYNQFLWKFRNPLKYYFRTWCKHDNILIIQETLKELNNTSDKAEIEKKITEPIKIEKKKFATRVKKTKKTIKNENVLIIQTMDITNKFLWKFSRPVLYFFNKWRLFSYRQKELEHVELFENVVLLNQVK
jgi:hypothetical protein